jgi:hypothetical protein
MATGSSSWASADRCVVREPWFDCHSRPLSTWRERLIALAVSVPFFRGGKVETEMWSRPCVAPA